MENLAGTSSGSVSASNAFAVNGGNGPPATSALSYNPQATVSEGLYSAVTAAQPLLALPAISSTVPVAVPRPSTRNHTSLSLLRGPVPQKGSGQDRFLQILKDNDHSYLASGVQSNPFGVPIGMAQRLISTRSHPPGDSAVDLPVVAANATAPIYPGGQKTVPTVVAPSSAKAKTSTSVKPELKGASPVALKRADGEANGQSNHQTVGVGANAQNHPVATARLSAQCQLRHFNPKWHESSGPKGFKCSVQLLDRVIHGGHSYATAYDAKQAVAEKALVYVLQLPCNDPAEKVAARIRSAGRTDRFSECNRVGRSPAKRELAANTGSGSFHGQYARPAPEAANAPVYNWSTQNHEQRALLHRIQSVFGGAGPSTAVLSDPLAAQAFLQGLAVGTSVRVASSVYEPFLEPRGRPLPVISGEIYRPCEAREQSPQPNFSRNYRHRSPLRQHTSYDPKTRQSD